ncbi:MAG: hypothetical protein JSW05_10055 [Candidatus Thorarchaeota archaeon]|nr:MAG: hypothetical protein JSW05_10055 [Candidatus Thorarchaeota archaeon]
MREAASSSASSSKVKVAAAGVALVVLSISVVIMLNVPSIEHVQSDPVSWDDVTLGQYVILYHRVISDDNITVGTMSFTWEVRFPNDSLDGYDYYELYFHEMVSGTEEGTRILGGNSVLNFTTRDQMLATWSEYHGAGAVLMTTSFNNSWGGDFQWRFEVAPDSGEFKPQLYSNKLDFELIVRTIPGADVNLTVVLVSEWLVHYQGVRKIIWTETLNIFVNRTAHWNS